MLNNNISENNARTDKERKWAEKWVEKWVGRRLGKGQTAAGSKSKLKIKQDKAVAKQMATR